MGKTPWEDDPDLEMLGRRATGPRWRRLLLGTLLVAAATFVGAYYLPLFRAHDTLSDDHHRLIERAESAERGLTRAQADLRSVTLRRDELENERRERESQKGKVAQELAPVQSDLATRFDKSIKKGTAKLAVSETGLMVALTDSILFSPKKVEVSTQGKQTLCELGKASHGRKISVRAYDGGAAIDPALSQSYPSSWSLRAARAAAALEALESQCKASPSQLEATLTGGDAQSGQAFAGSGIAPVHLEFELAAK